MHENQAIPVRLLRHLIEPHPPREAPVRGGRRGRRPTDLTRRRIMGRLYAAYPAAVLGWRLTSNPCVLYDLVAEGKVEVLDGDLFRLRKEKTP